MRNVRAKQGYIHTATRLNNFSPPSQGRKRRKLESTIPMPMLLAVGSSDKERSNRQEAEVGEVTPSSPLHTRSESTPSSPKRFFTDDGERESLAIGLLLSRREAGLEKWRRLTVVRKASARQPEAKDQSPSSLGLLPSVKTHSHSLSPDELASPEASQESYGGGWVDEVADKLLAGVSSAMTSPPRNTTEADQANSSKRDPAMTKYQ